MDKLSYHVLPQEQYDGPEFEEFCIQENRYLPASRDRQPCVECPLSNLCQAGFEEQVARLSRGEDPCLTAGCSMPPESLTTERLLGGLTEEQREFVINHIPGL